MAAATKVKKKLTIPRASKFEDRYTFVGVNGMNYIIPKGTESDVPEEVYEEYTRAQNAAAYYYDEAERMQKDAETQARNAGL